MNYVMYIKFHGRYAISSGDLEDLKKQLQDGFGRIIDEKLIEGGWNYYTAEGAEATVIIRSQVESGEFERGN